MYEFLRIDVFDARNFFDPSRDIAKAQTGREIPPFKRNIFGGSVGGPILRNRAFFFATYEGRRQSESETFRVPTGAERASITDPIIRSIVALVHQRTPRCLSTSSGPEQKRARRNAGLIRLPSGFRHLENSAM